MATYNTSGNLGNTNGTPSSTAYTGTIPAGVATGDVMIAAIDCFTYSGGSPAFSAPTSGGGSWAQIGTVGTNSQGSLVNYTTVWWRVATASDPGSTFSISFTGTNGSTNAYYWSGVVSSYTGFYTASPIGNFAQTSAISSSTPAAPTTSTTAANSWAVQIGLFAVSSGGTITASPATNRQQYNPGNGIDASLSDSSGSAGDVGTVIGGGSWTCSASTSGGGATYVIELRTQAVPSTVVDVTPPRIPHPRFLDMLLEEGYQRADWQAQGVASLQQQHWRLMDGAYGRPGTGSAGTQPPAVATSNGATAIVNGLAFYVTEGGKWFEGYWYYCCASGQSTSPVKFALWSVVTAQYGSSTVVPGSVVTSGTLTAGAWNWVPLPQPVQLGIYGVYTAAVGVPASAGYPDTGSQFGSGQPYAAGITNGPLRAFSSAGASNPATGSGNYQCLTSIGADPSLVMPGAATATSDNIWLDVQVTNTAPAGYSGSYRLWPNMADADPATTADSSVNYVIGTEVLVSQPVYVNKIWYFMPAGTAQFVTSADVWNVRNGVRVATQPNPVWRQISGAPATFTSGQAGGSAQWVWCDLPGPVYLPAGDYYVTVYNSNGSPDGWGAKRLGYWQAEGQAPDGTFQHTPPGQAGITNGPLTAPTTPAASSIQDYENNSNIEAGQSVFAVGPPNQFPNRYVGGSSGGGTGPDLYQNYWVDIEVTPASTWAPDAPDLPQRIPHPLFTDLLEVMARRMEPDAGTAPVPPSTAALDGTGFLGTAAVQGAPTALDAAGVLAASGTVYAGSGAALDGTGFLGTAAVQDAGASPAGTGFLTAAGSVSGSAGAVLTGAGSAGTAVTQRAGAPLDAAGYLNATPVGAVKVDITVFVGPTTSRAQATSVTTASRSQVSAAGGTQGDGKAIGGTQDDGKEAGPTIVNRSR